jgi:hypothetical protein
MERTLSTVVDQNIRSYPYDKGCLTFDDIYQNWSYIEDLSFDVSPTIKNEKSTERLFNVYFIDKQDPYVSFGYIQVNLHVDTQLASCIDEMYHHKGPLVWNTKEVKRSPRRQIPWMALVEFFLATSFMRHVATPLEKQRPRYIHVIMAQKEAVKINTQE